MSVDEAIEILSLHQQWRRGIRDEMIQPIELTEAIDTILNHLTPNHPRDNTTKDD